MLNITNGTEVICATENLFPRQFRLRAIDTITIQGSFLGPDFWNPSHNNLLELNIIEGSRLVRYIDDIAVFVPGRMAEKAKSRHFDATGKHFRIALEDAKILNEKRS